MSREIRRVPKHQDLLHNRPAEEFPEEGAVGGGREAKGDRGGGEKVQQ